MRNWRTRAPQGSPGPGPWLATAMLLVALSAGAAPVAGSVVPPPDGPVPAPGSGAELAPDAQICRGPAAGTLALARPPVSFFSDAPLDDPSLPLALSFGRRGARAPRAPRAAVPSGALGAERARILLRSLTLPGWGQATLGRRTSAAFFGLTETAIWGTFVAFRIQVAMREDAFRRTAGLQAGIDLEGRDEEWLRMVGDYASSDEYNRLVVLRDAANLYYLESEAYWAYYEAHKLKGADTWAWSGEGQLRYLDQRRNARRAAQRANTALAVAVVNRIVSALHAARAAGRPAPAAHSWQFEVVPGTGEDATAFQVRVHARF
jgi:hypothetical protein